MWSHKAASEAARFLFFKLEVSDPAVFASVKGHLMDRRPLGKMVRTAVDWDGTAWLADSIVFKWREPATVRAFHAWVVNHMPPKVRPLLNTACCYMLSL